MLLKSIFEYIKEGNIEIKEKYNDLVYFLKEYLSPLFIYYNEEKSRYEWFNKYNTEYFNLKGYTYISLDEHYNNNPYFDYNNFKSKLTYNRDLDYKLRR